MKKTEKALIALFLFALVISGSPGQQVDTKAAEKPIRVLFIGNSYTYYNDLPWLVSQLAAKESKSLETAAVTEGGATLKRHWENGHALNRLKQGRWDYVVLQEQSLLPINDTETMHRYARMFGEEIKKAGAKTIFFLTWARQNRPEMQVALTEAYAHIAEELSAIIAPVGIAWKNALNENSKLVLHDPDKSHPNVNGSYLAACVFYSILYDKSPQGLTGQIKRQQSQAVDISKEDAAFIQRVAWEAVKNSKDFYK